jgi:hypothetical protein
MGPLSITGKGTIQEMQKQKPSVIGRGGENVALSLLLNGADDRAIF